MDEATVGYQDHHTPNEVASCLQCKEIMSRLYGSGASAVGVGPFLTAMFGFVCMREKLGWPGKWLVVPFLCRFAVARALEKEGPDNLSTGAP